MLQAEAEDLRQSKLQTCLALLSTAPNLRELSFDANNSSNLHLHNASFVRMFSSLRKLHYDSVRPEPTATTASQLIEPLVQGLCSLEELSVTFEGAAVMNW